MNSHFTSEVTTNYYLLADLLFSAIGEPRLAFPFSSQWLQVPQATSLLYQALGLMLGDAFDCRFSSFFLRSGS